MKATRGFRRWLVREFRGTLRMWLDIRDKTDDIELATFLPSHVGPGQAANVRAGKASEAEAVRAVVTSMLQGEQTWRDTKRYGAILLLVMLMEGLLMVYYSKVQKDFSTCLEKKDSDGFYRGLWLTGMVIVVGSPVIAVHEFFSGMLSRMLRTSFTLRLARLYLTSAGRGCLCPFYRLLLTSDIDNPDQRVCSDATVVVGFIFGVVQEIVAAVIGFFSFSVVLLLQAPKLLLFILLYAMAGTLTMSVGFGPCVSSNQSLLVKQEADLRTRLVRVSENAESVAFFDGGGAEWLRFQGAFASLQATIWRRVMIFTGLDTFNRGYGLATFAVVPLMVGTRYLRGEVEFGAIAQISMAFSVVLGSLSLVMAKVSDIAGFLVSVRRLEQLEAALCVGSPDGGSITTSAELPQGGRVALQLRGMTLRTPPRAGGVQQTLIDSLSLQLQGGESLMIAGASGIGKSSLLRAVAGLWSDGGGRIDTQPARAIFFLPQKPYMVLGTLREQLLYPKMQRHGVEDSRLEDALQKVNLAYLLNHHALSDCKEWGSLLSPGEQQRVSFVRALIQEDLQLTLVDEGTSACDARNEANLYEHLKRCSRSYVSVGHRQALLYHHSLVLWLRRFPAAAGAPPAAADCELLSSADFERACGMTEWAA
uniref:ABC transporter domain-containing protein n=1 Tax=Alexandrium catenella TaxID=2925 RepID=A0A7S1PXD4_ALECA|mmetsp:Transcript_113810/g.302457  ORF Transcript_113810/g.302457 Transcript_113810/m.302457 type:complete len:648 (+) Transcript_113810:26-1969(+)